MLGFVLGCILGMVLYGPRADSVLQGGLFFVCGISFALFCTITSYAERSRTGWKDVLGLGAIAGMTSSFLFLLGVGIMKGTILDPGIWGRILKIGVYGTIFGAVIALLAFHARQVSLFSQVRWLRSTPRRLLFFGCLAGLASMVLFGIGSQGGGPAATAVPASCPTASRLHRPGQPWRPRSPHRRRPTTAPSGRGAPWPRGSSC